MVFTNSFSKTNRVFSSQKSNKCSKCLNYQECLHNGATQAWREVIFWPQASGNRSSSRKGTLYMNINLLILKRNYTEVLPASRLSLFNRMIVNFLIKKESKVMHLFLSFMIQRYARML